MQDFISLDVISKRTSTFHLHSVSIPIIINYLFMNKKNTSLIVMLVAMSFAIPIQAQTTVNK